MTVSTTTAKVTYTGDAVTTVYAYTFRILADADILVKIKTAAGVITTKVLTTDYTVSGAGDAAGGNVTFGAGDVPAAAETVIFTRSVDIKQETDYVEGDSFPANTHETALDKLTMIAQQTNEEVDRSMKVDAAVSGFDLTLPTPVADKFLAVNSGATAFIMADDTSVIGGLSKADGTIYVGDGTTVVAETGSTARDSLGLGTGDSPQFTTIELGAATDTTVARASAGVVTIEGVNIVTTSSTDTLTNKPINTASNTITILEADISDLQAYITTTTVVDDTTPQLGGDLDTNGNHIQFDDSKGILDDSGNEQLMFIKTASAINHLEMANQSIAIWPELRAAGDDTNIGINFFMKGDAAYHFKGTATASAELRLGEDTDNGSNYMGIKAPAVVTANITLVLPDGDGSANQVLKTDASANLSWASVTDEVSAASDTVAGKIEIATAAEMETGTSTTLAVVPGRVQNHAGVAKVWLLMRYTTGTPGDIASHNVSSLTDTNTGEITVNFTAAMSSASYPAMVTRDGATSLGFVSTARTHGTGSVLMDMRNDAGAAADLDGNLVIFGDQ